MTVRKIVNHLNLKVVAGARGLNRSIQGAYISDLLSDVIAKARPDMVWLTIQTHKSIIAVAVLKDLAAIILPGGKQANNDTRDIANIEGIPLLLSNEYAFELAGKLYILGLRNSFFSKLKPFLFI